MNKKINYILASVFLLTFLCQLILSSSLSFYSDENSEEETEVSFEDLLEKEIIQDTYTCSYEWIISYNNDNQLSRKTVFTPHLLRNYSIVDRSIPVPPPEKIA